MLTFIAQVSSVPALQAAQVEAADSDIGARLFIFLVGLALLAAGLLGGAVFRQSEEGRPPWRIRLRRTVGALMAAWGAFIAISAWSETINEQGWHKELAAGMAQARQSNSPVLVDCWAQWCKPCLKLYNETLQDPTVAKRLSGYTKIKLDLQSETDSRGACTLLTEGGNIPYVALFENVAALQAELNERRLAADRPTNSAVAARARLLVREFVAPDAFVAMLEGSAAPQARQPIAQWLEQKGIWLTLLLIFIGGIALSFTPCVAPLYMITVTIIGARNAQRWTSRLLLSLVYVCGLVLTYATLGLVAGLSGGAIGAAFENGWVVAALSLLFFLMGLSYLELFTVDLPGGLKAKLSGKGGEGYLSALVMGLLCGLLAAPCAGPMVLGILGYIAKTQDAWLGFWMMFTLALGMGLLFVGIGTSTSLFQKLRGIGKWGYRIETTFALCFLGLGMYYLRTALPALGKLFEALAQLSPF